MRVIKCQIRATKKHTLMIMKVVVCLFYGCLLVQCMLTVNEYHFNHNLLYVCYPFELKIKLNCALWISFL